MGFHLDVDGSSIETADGRRVGTFRGTSATIELTVEGEPSNVLIFVQAVGAAYAAAHPDVNIDVDGSSIKTADGTTVGTFLGTSATIELTAKGEADELLIFLRAVGAAYAAIHPDIHIDVELDEEGDTTWTGLQRLDEQTVKVGGQVIRVHKSDVDPWPSDLHGHPLDHPGQKIDAYSGEIFRITDRKKVGKMGKKDLERLQAGLRKAEWAATKLDARKQTKR